MTDTRVAVSRLARGDAGMPNARVKQAAAGGSYLGDLDGIRVMWDVLVGGPLKGILLRVPAAAHISPV